MNIYPNRLLSLDMGNHSYKYVEAQLLSSGDFKIQRFGELQKSDFFNCDKPARIWRRIGIRTRNVVFSYHHSSLIVRELKLKAMDEFHLQNVIYEEFQKYQTELNEDFDFDYTVQSCDYQSGIYTTKTAGISKHVNREYIEKAISLGLRPSGVDIQVNAFIRLLRKALCNCDKMPGFPYLVLDLGYEYTTCALVNGEEIIALKGISTGCRKINDSSKEQVKYLKEISQLCSQMIGYFIFNYEREELNQGILYGGGAHISSIITILKEETSLKWSYLQHLHPYLPNIPVEMNLNLYGNCLGSIYWELEKLREMRGKKYARL